MGKRDSQIRWQSQNTVGANQVENERINQRKRSDIDLSRRTDHKQFQSDKSILEMNNTESEKQKGINIFVMILQDVSTF